MSPMPVPVPRRSIIGRVKDIMGLPGYRSPIGFGICRVDHGQINRHKVLQAQYPVVNWEGEGGHEISAMAALFLNIAGFVSIRKNHVSRDIQQPELVLGVTRMFLKRMRRALYAFANPKGEAVRQTIEVIETILQLVAMRQASYDDFRAVFLFEDAPPQTVESAYLKLMALSLGKVPLRSLNLEGMFGLLQTVAWVGTKPYELDYLRKNEINMKLSGTYPAIDAVDKFPRYLGHVIPADSTRIMDSSRVRLGAQLAPGTVVMPGASYINFNAGTEGPTMVEGRISSSVKVGAHTDIGGGASIMGVLSGGNTTPISVGESCLLGANSVTGISYGHGCIIDAGVTVLAGSKIEISLEEAKKINEANPGLNLLEKALDSDKKQMTLLVKGQDLNGLHGIHYRRDSQTGKLVAFRSRKVIELNEDLHGAGA